MSQFASSAKFRYSAGALLVALAMGLGLSHYESVSAQAVSSQAPPAAVPVDPHAVGHAKALSKAFRQVAEGATPSVVTIETKTKARQAVRRGTRNGENPFKGGENPFKGTPFEKFFNEDMQGQFENLPQQPQQRQSGVGSGIIIDASGVILTNRHVVNNADEVRVRLHDGREYKATEVKTDEHTDLAVLKISGAKNLKAAKLGDSDALDIGDWVVAVGNPFGLDLTVTTGIISAKQRGLSSSGVNFLQTDAAINPGNSGGPLFNLEGEVIGINTAIASSSGGYQGVGFAIPSNVAKWVSKELLANGQVRRAYLGVAIQELDDQLAQQFQAEPHAGVAVTQVYPGSPAADAGLKQGDVITTFAGKRVQNPRGLTEVVQQLPFGSRQKATVLREGKPMEVEVTVKARPGEFGAVGGKPAPSGEEEEKPASTASNELGLEVSDLTSEVAEKMGLKGFQGVLVSRVVPDSPADEAGLSTGMLVVEVGGKPVKDVRSFEEAVKKQSVDKGVLLLVRSNGGSQFVVVKKS
jgi:serine protease Do